MPPKKSRRNKQLGDFDDDEIDLQKKGSNEIDDQSKAEAPAKKTSKKKQAKKNKKQLGDWDEDEETPEAQAAAVNGAIEEDESAVKAKKNQAEAKSNFAALSLEDEGEEEQDEDTTPPRQASSKGKKNKKKGGSVFAALDDDPELDAEAEVEAEEEQEEVEEERQYGNQQAVASTFALLEEDDNDAAVAEEDEQVPATEQLEVAVEEKEEIVEERPQAKERRSKDKQGKKGKAKGENKALDAIEGDLDAASIDPQAATILSVEPHPSANKLKICTVSTGSESFRVVTNAAAARDGLKIVFAGIGAILPGSGETIGKVSLRGVESQGMLCSAFDVGWSEEPDGVLIELPSSISEGDKISSQPVEGALYGAAVAEAAKHSTENGVGTAEELAAASSKPGKKGKDKKKKANSEALAAAFAALEVQPEEENEAESVTEASAPAEGANGIAEALPKEKKKKKARAFDPDAAFQAAVGVAGSHENGALPEEPPDKKKKGKKKSGFDVDAMLAEAVGGSTEAGQDTAANPSTAPPSTAEDAAQASEAVKEGGKKNKKNKDKAGKEEDLDALLAEFGVDTEQVAETQKSKKKKKGKAGTAEVAAEPDQASATAADTSAAAGSTAEASGVPASEAQEARDGNDAEAAEDDADEPEDEKEMTAAQRKKLKKKQKEKAKKAEGGDKDAPAKKGPAKKESAAVRKLREDLERQKAEQEAAQKAEEERIRLEEEAAQRAEEEAKQREEDRKRRKEEKAKERAELKRKGLLLTGKEKAEAERLAAIREQLLKDNPNLELPAAGQAKKKPMYTKKKGPSKMKQDDAAALEAKQREEERARQEAETARLQKEEEEKQKAEEARRQAEAEAEAAAAAVQEAEESDDIGWDEIDVDQIKLPGQEPEPEPIAEEESPNEPEEKAEEEKPAEPARETKKEVSPEVKAVPNGTRKTGPAEKPQDAKKQKTEPQKPKAKPAVADSESSGEAEDEEDEEESSEEEESSDEEDSSEEESSSEYSSSEESMDSEEAREERIRNARAARAVRLAAAKQAGKADDLRSPICCILGHVDTGKTKLLDNIRRTSVQEGEAGGITQQIGATYVPGDAICTRTEPVRKGREFGLKVPGLLIIDTPGHESFTNLRSRGSSLCDIAILVVDIMHGLEPQTIESINLLKQKKTPFIVALNKVDRLFEWKSLTNAAIQDSLAEQKSHVVGEYEKNLQRAILNLNEQGLNVALYWKNPDPRKYVNIVPTSAITGEGIPDMLQLVVQLTQKMMAERLMFISELQCTVLEVKVIEGLGTTVDVVLVNGVLREGDQIVLCGLQGPIVTTIRSLLTPHPLKELRVRGSYLHHKEVKAAQGIKIAAQNLENAVAGTQMLVVQKGDSIEDLKEEVMGDMTDIFKSVDKSGEGVCVQASTLGSLEALLEFLRSDAVKIPVSGINIGPVHKRDVMRASTMLEKGRKKYAVILAFDVVVTKEAQEQANSAGVRIFTADIIYHLFDQFSAYLKHSKEEEQQAASADAVFPVILQIMENCIFNAKDPIVLGCSIEEGIAKVGTPLCIPSRGGFSLGKIASMELNHKPVDIARRGDSIALKIESNSTEEASRLYGRHFDFKDKLISRISRRSIDLLKLHFKDSLERDDWRLVVKLKKMFGID